ncbi:MFS general substrate transporter [Penicillium longicatenatum]|nr:MFS general substrate transporter [Penicillium longicatenatum]
MSLSKLEKGSVEFTEDITSDVPPGHDDVLVDSSEEIRRLPIPSKDPNDPLNFPFIAKLGIIVSCCWFSMMSLSVTGGLGSVLGGFDALYAPEGVSETEVAWLTTLPSLFIGIGNYVILPLGLAFGKRPVTLMAIMVLLGATIGCGFTQTYEQHLALRIIQGVAIGATESLLPLILSEVTFVHQRGNIYGLYWATQTIVSSCMNLASSYEVAALGWRWYYWIFVITIGAGGIVAFFGCFETAYRRSAHVKNDSVIVTDNFGVTRVLAGEEAQAYISSNAAAENRDNVPDEPRPKKSYGEMIKPWSHTGNPPVATVPQTWYHMLQALTSPGIIYATLLSSAVLAAAIGISLTYDTVLQDNYGWPAANVGLINLGGVFDSLGGMLYGGPELDFCNAF